MHSPAIHNSQADQERSRSAFGLHNTICWPNELCSRYIIYMLWCCWSDQYEQIYQTISLQCIAMFLLYTRLWGPNSNEGHNGTSRLRYVWVCESRRAGLEVLRPPLRQIRPNCCTGSVVCTTRLSIPKCQSNTHHQPTNPMNPTLISWHFSQHTQQSKSKSTNPNAIYLSSWHASDFGNISPVLTL